jgi:hypothetical protein
MGRSDTLHPAAVGKNSGTPSIEAWFAGGERFGYDPKAAAIVASAPLKVFLKREGDLAHAVSFLPGYPDGSFGWAKVLPYLPNAAAMRWGTFISWISGSRDKPFMASCLATTASASFDISLREPRGSGAICTMIPIRRYLHDTGKSLFVWDCVVADAVAVEPVSASKFPANREKNRDSCENKAPAGILTPNPSANSVVCSKIPYSLEQGIFIGRAGNLSARTGNLTHPNWRRMLFSKFGVGGPKNASLSETHIAACPSRARAARQVVREFVGLSIRCYIARRWF